MNSLPKHQTSQIVEAIPLREHLQHSIDVQTASLKQLIEERDRLYTVRFEAANVAVNTALAAQEKAVGAAFLASEKAIIKAEEAQREYNVRSNEFRGQLDDQAKMLMPRSETLTMLKALEDRVETIRLVFNTQLEAQRLSFEKTLDLLKTDVMDLRESRSESHGGKVNLREVMSYIFALVGVAIAATTLLLKSH